MTPPPFRRGRAQIATWLGRAPRWLRVLLGIAAIGLGSVLIVRPTTSLGVLAVLIGVGLIWSGVVDLFDRPDGSAAPTTWQTVRAIVWVAAGVIALVLPGLTVRLLVVVVAVALVTTGALSAVSALRKGLTFDVRVAAVALGAAEIVFGVLALSWPDITLLIVSVVFGARLIMAGILAVWHAARPKRPQVAGAQGPSALHRWSRTIGAVLALLLAAAATIVSIALHAGTPVVDAFYAPPRDVPAAPGQLIRSEPFTRDVPGDAIGWRILYTTTRGDGSAAVASGLVVVPRDGNGPWPVIDWAHGTTGYAQNCAPSLATHPFESGALFILDKIISNGWALVATDYIGLGTQGPHPYLIGPDTAHAALDAARAARQLTPAHLGEQNIVWGHSQGGGAALWTGALANQYAPDLTIGGVAALAPASNLPGLVENLPNITGGSVFAAYVFEAYAANYSDVRTSDY